VPTKAGQRSNRASRSAARSLPLAEWPDAERTAWERALRPGWKLGHRANRLGQETRKDLRRRYGQFLHFCSRTGRLDPAAEPGSLVTLDAITGFIAEHQARVGSVTVAQSVFKVCRAARLIAPTLDFTWLSEIAKDLALIAEPMNKSARVVTTARLVEAGLTLVAEAGLATSSPLVVRSLMARNGLMVAMLAVCPIRLKNFAALEIDKSFVEQEGTWWIVLRNTKSRRPDERPIPDYLNDAIKQYLEVYRPALRALDPAKRQNGNEPTGAVFDRDRALWIGRLGDALSYGAVQRIIPETTRETIGVDVSPHLVRASAATTAALHSANNPNLASALLHHTRRSVTEDHYNRASSLSVAGQFARLVRSL
jgi:integrase